jgi:uncharacterized protein DUF1841
MTRRPRRQEKLQVGVGGEDPATIGYNPVLQAAMYEVVDNQLHDNRPPETRQTLERLLAQGYSRDEARRLIANVVASEIFSVLKKKKPYDEARFVAALRWLPRLPWEE